ncbi:MAG: HAMP domain-containing sensor histidine kinase [Pseudomonadota bacterium]|nr:HAMP domain-containing sensor histidine kinase [Pseudomonadota bacterium]
MSIRPESWLVIGRNVVAAISLALLTVLAVILLDLRARDQAITDLRGYELSGTAGRWRDEALVTLLALDRYVANSGRPSDLDDLKLRVDILWNRVSVLEGGRENYHTDIIPGAGPAIRRSRELITDVDRALATLDPATPASIDAVRQPLLEMVGLSRQVSLQAGHLHGSLVAESRMRLDSLHSQLVAAIIAIAVSVAVLIGLLITQSRRLRRSVDDLQVLNAEVMRQAELVQQAGEAKMRFLGHMSHELRTPLNAIIGFADLIRLQMFGPVQQQYQDYVTSISEGAHELSRVLQQILEIARHDTGRSPGKVSVFDIGTVVREAVNSVRHGHRGEQAGIDIRLPEEAMAFEADPSTISQIVWHLASNALRHTPADGQVIVSAHPWNVGDGIEIVVRDSGSGMSREEKQAALGTFSVANHLTARSRSGIGLGLRIVQRNVEVLGGRFRLVSRKGHGTIAMVRLPRRPLKRRATDRRAIAA